ncbi:four-carbon acid sugar kinase family protein [Streptomyces sp. NPDC002285]
MMTTAMDPLPGTGQGRRFVVLADDLTSAAEAAGHLADTGQAASVVLDPDDPSVPGHDAWPCVDLDSRHVPRAEAARRHEQAVCRLLATTGRNNGSVGIYKTMDSSLRGNWAAELAAVMRTSGRTVAVVAPACPAYDRRTVHGHQLAGGIPVHLGPAGKDPVRPVTNASLLTPLTGQGMLVTPTDAAKDDLAASVSYALTGALEKSGTCAPLRALVVDASTESDLKRIAAAVGAHQGEVVLCGSPGLWEAVMPLAHTASDAAAPAVQVQGRALALIGSLHPTTREQLARLCQSGIPVFTTADLARHSDPVGHLTRALSAHEAVALTTPEDRETEPRAAARHLRDLAAVGASCARALPSLGLVLSGGDTAREIAVALQAPLINMSGTVAPGISLGTLAGPHPHPVITKAGGFGRPESLISAVGALTRRIP